MRYIWNCLDGVSPKCNWDVTLSYSSLTCSYNFLAVRRALNDPKRLLSFLWPARQAFEREMERDFRAREGKGGEPFFYIPRTRAVVRPNSFALPFRRPATQTILFLDSLWCRCHLRICFVPRYHYRTIRNESNRSFLFISSFPETDFVLTDALFNF